MMGLAELLDVLQSLLFHARRLAGDHPGDVDLARAVDALAGQIDTLVETLVPGGYRTHHSLTFRVSPARERRLTTTTRGSDQLLVVDDASGAATLALAAASYSHIAAALRAWADHAEAAGTVF